MIAKSAIDKTNFSRNIHLTNSAREGWGIILKSLEPSSKILLPSYIGITDREGSGIYDPVISTGLDHDFYMLNDDLTISISEVEKCLVNGSFKLILLVHYFGFRISNIEEIVRLCMELNVIVVEDCAHIFNYNLYDLSSVGTYGDFAFYSLHKYFPVDKGGMVVQNTQNSLELDCSGVILESEFATQIIKYDIEAIAIKRRENFDFLHSQIKEVDGIRSIKLRSDEDIPHNYPIFVENDLREKLYFWLMERGVPLIALYYRLIDPLKNEKYKPMKNLSDNILNLPVHQDMESESIKFVCESLKTGIKSLNT